MKNGWWLNLVCVFCAGIALMGGCRGSKPELSTGFKPIQPVDANLPFGHESRIQVSEVTQTNRPRSTKIDPSTEYWELTLDEAIHVALRDTSVLRSLGATIVQNPATTPGSFDPALRASDPIFGMEAALAQFDRQMSSSLNFAKNDDVFNNPIIGGGATEVRDDVATGLFSLSRTGFSGTQFSLRGQIDHSKSNNPALLFPHSWTTLLEATARQPLMQGRGSRFNQIAGPNNSPGLRNTSGIVLSRIDHEISIAQFETSLVRMVQEIIEAYWQLDLAYKNYESIKTSRDIAETTWRIVRTRFDNELPGGEADREAQAREQLYRFESQRLTAMNGDPRSNQVGILQAEANLRRLLKLSQRDQRLIKPKDDPIVAETVYNWPDLAALAIDSRVEIREQRKRVGRRQLELEAARNFLLPRFDAVATYRNNGFGDDLAGGGGRFSSALGDALNNDHGEWELGLTYDIAVGFRQAKSAVRNANLALCREKAILQEQQEQVLFNLGSSLRQVEQDYGNVQILSKRFDAARETFNARTAAYDADAAPFDELLDAQQRLSDAQLELYRVVNGFEASKAGLLVQAGRLLDEFGINIHDHLK